jgi:polyhydroxyalkanoate synthase
MSDDSNASAAAAGSQPNPWAQLGQAFSDGFQQWLRAQAAFNSQSVLPQVNVEAQAPESEAVAGLQRQMWDQHARLWQSLLQREPGAPAAPVIAAEPGDKRFSAPSWSESPIYDYLRQAYLINAGFVQRVADAVPMADGRAKDRLRFLTRQFVEAMAPSNFAATNPEFIRNALQTNGESIKAGIQNLISDLQKGRISMTDDRAFEVGRNLAATPGAVVYQNELIQLIQYAPLTPRVAERPLLIVPPCINKFYILDLQPENSFVRYAVEQGNTVFLVSWRNVKTDQGRLGWDDYLEMGPLAALAVVREICGVDQVNALGFCVGGTMLSAAMAVARVRGEDPVASLTLLTTLLDFSDAGEIGSLVDEALVVAREATIGKGGLMMGRELANVFSSLRGNDLIWQYVVGNYLKGATPPAFDLLYWNSDATNLPGPFLTWYLRNMYLENSLRVPAKLSMCGARVDLGRIDAPAFVYASRDDHIVPWKTAYLSRGLLGGETTFVLGASGHIAGVINSPAKNKRCHWRSDSTASNAQEWLDGAREIMGSWWPQWADWLRGFGGGDRAAPRLLGSAKFVPGEAAPGSYVKEAT